MSQVLRTALYGFLASVAFALPASASADASFELSLAGSGIYQPRFFPSCPDDNPNCDPVPIDWTGTVTIVTSSSADGIYTGPGFVSISIYSNLIDFMLPGVSLVEDIESPAFVTLSNGQVTSVDFHWGNNHLPDPQGQDIFGIHGLSAGYFRCCFHHGDAVDVSGVLTNIPEPETICLMLAGLAMTSLVLRHRKAHVRVS